MDERVHDLSNVVLHGGAEDDAGFVERQLVITLEPICQFRGGGLQSFVQGIGNAQAII